jgi:hypothetical protein
MNDGFELIAFNRTLCAKEETAKREIMARVDSRGTVLVVLSICLTRPVIPPHKGPHLV